MSEDISKRKTEYEKMSISRLEELLREDALCDTCPDPRELLLIASVLEAKRRELEPEGLPEPSAELAAFREHYEPMAADREIHICAEEKKPAKRRPFRLIAVAAAAIALLLAGSIASSALGFDLWKNLSDMTRRYFVITATPAPGSSETLDELRSTLEINGLPTDVVPSYIPGGYTFESMDTDTDGVRDIFRCHFTDGEEHLLLIYNVNVDGSPAAVSERDEVERDVRSFGGRDYYFATGEGDQCVVWAQGSILCSIVSSDPKLDLTAIVRSI